MSCSVNVIVYICYDYTISSLNGAMIFTLAKLLVGDWCSHHSTDQWGMCMEEP
jgi:hypothetical protein